MISPKGRYAVYRAALDTYGAQAQTIIAMEEMAELTKELSKNLRGANNTAQIAEEIADVRIMLDQMALLHGCEGLQPTTRRPRLTVWPSDLRRLGADDRKGP